MELALMIEGQQGLTWQRLAIEGLEATAKSVLPCV
jgi:hypothetical protein